MSDMKFNCPECNGALEVDESAAGRLVDCPQCKKQIKIPSKTSAPPVAAPVAATQPAPVTQEQKACPFCGETILAVAKKCKHCGELLEKKNGGSKETFAPTLAAVNLQSSRASQAAPTPTESPSTLTMPPAGINVTPLPPSVAARWYYHDGINQVGPFDALQIVELIKNGTIKHHTQVWKEGAPAWGQAATELAQYLSQIPPPMSPPPPVFMPPPVTAQGYYPPPVQAPSNLVYPRQPPRSPGWMAFASFMILGLGQGLVGQKAKGWITYFGGSLCYTFLLVTLGFDAAMPLSLIILNIPAAIDAFMVAKRLRNGRPVGKWVCFPNPNQ